jgi:hypothetical protein
MSPYLRPLDSTAPTPHGWTVEPAGPWNGHQVEVVYNPTRHDVMFVRGAAADDISDNDLEHIGYQFIATDGQTWLWHRDRLTAARSRLGLMERGATVPTNAIGL